ncbi:MAG: hypothetical protein EPO02_10545 [Nitrospirae bacterium]|nr:MAG: hypothetical protein EPO02_10545 [Nitrospirota bacterium]
MDRPDAAGDAAGFFLSALGAAVRGAVPTRAGPVMKKVCGNCGCSFPCGGGAEPCWCDQVRLNESHLTEIGQRFRDCLCPACLEKIGAGLTGHATIT